MLDDLTNPDRAIEPARVPVEGLMELLGGLMSLRVRGANRFVLDVPTSLPDLWCERIAILRVFDNLLTNAIRHNPEADGLRIWIRARLVNQMIEFEVGDSGQGIPPEAQAQLFEFGYRLDSTGRVKGQGMGLWSCRRIVEAHGGRIWVKSAPGKGAQFFFTLPVASTVSSQPSPARLTSSIQPARWAQAETVNL
jgi:signal transduction histidine kinase